MSEEDVLVKGATDRGKRQVDLGSVARMWPTPCAQEDQKSPEAHIAMKERMKGGPRSTVTSLTVAAKLWPTPATTDASGHGYAMDRGVRVVKTLSGVADAMWPTPSTAMVAGYTKDEAKRGRRTSGGNLPGHQGNELLRRASSLPDPTISQYGPKSSPSTRRLNPRFVSWLMGLPVGWTDTTTPLARTSFERWATESSRWLGLLLSAYSPSGRR